MQIDWLDALRFGAEREAFLQTIPEDDREEVDTLTRSYDSSRNHCGLNDVEQMALVRLTVKYPGMSEWLF